MKKLISCVIASIVLIMAMSCSHEFSNPDIYESGYETEITERYDEKMSAFAHAMNKAVNENVSFRRFIKNEVLKQIGGDYNIVLSTVADRKIQVSGGITKSGVDELSVKELIAQYYYCKESMTRTTGNSIDELLNEYPDLQISMPVHADEWDENTYIPNIAIIPSDYEDLVTETVPGIDAEGNPIVVDAINEPDEPYLVLGLAERVDTALVTEIIDFSPIETKPILISPVLKGHAEYIDNSIELSVSLINIDKSISYSIVSYNVYRLDSKSEEILIASDISGNDIYQDKSVVGNNEYIYKLEADVVRLDNGYHRALTTKVSAITEYDIPSPVTDFSVIAISSDRNELKWTNNPNELNKTVIYRTTPTQTRKKIAILDSNEDIYYDINTEPGEKWSYEIRKINEKTGLQSTAEFGYVYNPYRNPEGVSRVMLRRIHVNSKEVEGWLAGKPEFYISVYGMNANKEITKLGSTLDVKFAKDKDDSQDLNGLLHNWSYFNDMQYYPALNFNMIEYDRGKGSFDLSVTAKAGLKYRDYISLDAVGTYTLHYEHEDKDCGCASILYFEDPNQTVPLQSYGASITISE